MNKHLIFFILTLMLTSHAVASDDELEIISDEKAAAIKAQLLTEPPRLFLYSKPFAERFGLDTSKAMDLDPRLLAVKFEIKPSERLIVEKYNALDTFMCHLSVYLDSSVDTSYPVKPFLEAIEYSTTRATIRDDLPNLTDSQLNEFFHVRFTNQVFLATSTFKNYDATPGRDYYRFGLIYSRVLTDAFKGVNYIEFSPYLCAYLQSIIGKKWNFWLLKSDRGNHDDLLAKYSADWQSNWARYKSDFILIPFPADVMELPEIQLANEYNNHLIFNS